MKLRHQHRLAADDQHLPQLVDKARIVEQGRKHDRVVVRAGIQKPLIGGGCFENGPRTQDRAFWQPRRARCEAYDRRIVGGRERGKRHSKRSFPCFQHVELYVRDPEHILVLDVRQGELCLQ